MQITQERSGYAWFGDKQSVVYETYVFNVVRRRHYIVFVTNIYLLQSTYLKNSHKVKESAKNVYLWYKHKLADIYVIHCVTVPASSMTVCCSPCYTSIIHCFSSLTSRILLLALLHCFPDFIVTLFRLELLRQSYILQD